MSIYYDYNKCLSYNRLFNFLIGTRGVGKTYGALEKTIKRYLKDGKQFIYLRRYKTELKSLNILNPLKETFPEHTFTTKGKQFYCDNKVIGYAIPLSTAMTYKSIPFNNVWCIIYDEFLVDSSHYRYLNNEVREFLDFYETVNRLRKPEEEVIVFFIANALSQYNIYFNYFHIKLNEKGIFKNENIYAELIYNQSFVDEKKKTRFGKLIADSEYEKYSVYNNFYLDDDKFVEKRTLKSKNTCTFIISGKSYGIWFDTFIGLIYISEDFDPYNKNRYCFSTKDLHYNTILLNSLKRSSTIRTFIECARHGDIRYESMTIKNETIDTIKLILGR